MIANSIELVMRGRAYDGLISFGGCDKNLPGIMMAMVRCNVPSVFIFGGVTLTGSLHGKPVSVRTTGTSGTISQISSVLALYAHEIVADDL